MTWYVVAHPLADDSDKKRNVWTLSKNPTAPGWNTNEATHSYGLSKEDAEFLVTAANEKLARDARQGQNTLFPPHVGRTYSIQYGRPCVVPKPGAMAYEVINYAYLIGALYEEESDKLSFVVALNPDVGPELWSEEALRRSLPKREENMSSSKGFSFKKLDREMVRAPGFFSSEDLRIAANELKEFLGLFRMLEAILEITPISDNVLMSHIRTLEQTANLVKERDR